MSKKIFTKVVHLMNGAEVVSFKPGDPVPAWADERVTNPAVYTTGTVKQDDTPPVSSDDTPATTDELDALKADELKSIATDLGIPAKGNKDALKAAIRAKRSGDAPSEPADGRAALEAQAREKDIDFDENTTDAELEALIEGD